MMLLSLSLLTVRPRVVLVLWCLSLMNIVLFVVADATAGDIFLSLFCCCFYATVLFPFPFSSTTDAEFFDTIVVVVCLLLL